MIQIYQENYVYVMDVDFTIELEDSVKVSQVPFQIQGSTNAKLSYLNTMCILLP